MQEVMAATPEGTLNSNIAKELVWRRNAPYFYQTLYAQELEWPSLSVEWWVNENEGASDSSDEYRLCHLFYGTHTSGEEKNSLIMAKVYLPNQAALKRQLKDRPLRPSETIRKNDESMADKIVVQHQIEHDGEVNRIRHHPKRTNLIATRTPLGQIHIFDKIRFGTASKSVKPIRVQPSLVLSGHETEGYSLEWNPHK
jgi:histone-binding protein RBBP4